MAIVDEVAGALPPSAQRRRLFPRLWSTLAGAWAAFVGILPHVLHHVGPLAGAALMAGAGGRALFAGLGFLLAIPFLRRLRRRFGSWLAPGIALAVMAVMFSISSFVIGPLFSGSEDLPPVPPPGVEQPAGHEPHH